MKNPLYPFLDRIGSASPQLPPGEICPPQPEGTCESEMCSIFFTFPKAKRAAGPFLTTSQRIRQTSLSGSTIRIDQGKDSHPIEKYIVTLTHTLEKRFRMHYTYWCGIAGYLLFLKLLVATNSANQHKNAFDLINWRRTD
jgi:hypothetical protein